MGMGKRAKLDGAAPLTPVNTLSAALAPPHLKFDRIVTLFLSGSSEKSRGNIHPWVRIETSRTAFARAQGSYGVGYACRCVE